MHRIIQIYIYIIMYVIIDIFELLKTMNNDDGKQDMQ